MSPPVSQFESFFRANYTSVLRIARRVLNDDHLAEDVAQDVFIAARLRFGETEGSSHAVGWVRVAAAHAALNEARGRRRRAGRHLRAGAPAAPPGPEELVLERCSGDEVRRALGRMPPRASTVIVLRHSGLSYAEVAEAMGVKVGQVGTMLRRAEAALRKEIEHGTRLS
ncbi:MAG: RNA polymerase sigma factor [Acidimicrobiales bacterium]